jgi:hypothetical protein
LPARTGKIAVCASRTRFWTRRLWRSGPLHALADGAGAHGANQANQASPHEGRARQRFARWTEYGCTSVLSPNGPSSMKNSNDVRRGPQAPPAAGLPRSGGRGTQANQNSTLGHRGRRGGAARDAEAAMPQDAPDEPAAAAPLLEAAAPAAEAPTAEAPAAGEPTAEAPAAGALTRPSAANLALGALGVRAVGGRAQGLGGRGRCCPTVHVVEVRTGY